MNNLSKKNVRTVIALHGWTGNIKSMESVIGFFKIPNTRWILIEAPYKSKNSGFTWFQGSNINGWSYNKSFDTISSAIDKEIRNGVKIENISLLGFSQGAAILINYILENKITIGGCVLISGFLRYSNNLKINSIRSRILIIHGERDKVVPINKALEAKKKLEELGCKPEFLTFKSGHKVPLKAIVPISDFIIDS